MTIIHFSLLGPFEAQVGTAERKPLGDALAAKILAFLAFHGRFCTRAEIIAACWGTEKVAGKAKLDDEAYQKQIYKARELFTDVLALPWRDYFHSQPNGAQLNDGTFTTDIIGFNALLSVGAATEQSAAVRLDALQRADKYRRGVFLDGMQSEWIVSQAGGARKEYGEKIQAMHREISKLQTVIDGDHPNVVSFCDGFYQALPHFRKAVGEARHEITLYGMDLRVTIPVIYDLLQERLQAGVRVRFLLLNPDGRWPKVLAHVIGDEETGLRDECRASLRKLTALSKQLGETPLLEIAMFDGPIFGRMYGTDINHSGGKLFYFPYVDGAVPTRLPGYIWPHRQEGPYQFYAAGLRQSWDTLRTLSV
jgi:hypothetical protein